MLLGIFPQVLPHQVRREAVKTSLHRGMRGEQVAGPRHLVRHLKGLAGGFHEIRGPLQYGESRMAFVEMADFRIQSQGLEEPPAADAQHDLLGDAHLHPAAIQFIGDAAHDGRIFGVVQVQEI
jgi:hypothetical protein